MPTFDFIVPLPSIAEDNESLINKASILFKDAGGFSNPNSGCLGWNFNHCPNDDDYCQPFIKGDQLYLQLLIDVKQYYHISSQFINSATGQPFDATAALLVQSGLTPDRDVFVNVVVDTGNALFDNIDCWYVESKLYKCNLTQDEDFLACVEDKVGGGMTLQQAKDACYDELCDDFDELVSEPYCRIRCEKPSLLIGGSYTNYDCNGNYYGLLSGQPNIFKLQTRILGTLDPDGFIITETRNRLKKVKSQQREKFLLRSGEKLPYYVARQIVACFNSQDLTIDGVSYTGVVKLDKNFEEGEMWIMNENVYIDCDEINFTCQ